MLTEREKDCLNHFYTMFEHQWKLNDIYRTQYDEDLEYYIGYRDEKKYPLFYNMFFPQLLPRILTMLGRMLEQIYQGGTNELVSARPRKRSDVERAPRIRGLLNYQLENLNAIDKAGSSYLFNLQWMTNALAWGKGVAKLYWRKEERIAPLRKYFPFPVLDKSGRIQGFDIRSTIVEAPQIVYDAPYAEVLHPKMAVPHPNYKNIQLMPGFFIVYRRTLDQVVKNVEKGIYRSDSLEQLKDSFANTSKEPSIGNKSYEAISKSIELEGLDFATFKSDYSSPGIDIIEGYAKYIFPEDEVPYELGSGVKIKGKESEAICHFDEMGKVLFKIQKNTYGFRPFFDISGIMHPETFYDLGIIRLGKDIQDQYNTLANTRHQGSIMQLMQMLKVREDADIPPEALIWKPFGLIPVENMEDVEIFPTADLNQSGVFREQEEFFKSTIEDMTGMYRYNMGSTPTRQEHVGTIYCLDSDTYEILTDEGWKKFDELHRAERVMTLNYETDAMSWEKPTEFIEFPENEYEIYHFENASSEFFCTGDHRLPIEREGRNGFVKQIVRAKELSECSHAKIPLTGKWHGQWHIYNNYPDFVNILDISPWNWFAFMGIWLAEGHIYIDEKKWRYTVCISQENEEKSEAINELLSQMPYKWNYNGHQWRVANKELCEYLRQFGKSYEKFIPEYIKNADPIMLERFYQWFHLGDGHINHGGQRCITTASPKLADDIQEIILKLGNRAHIWSENPRMPHHHIKYHVHESSDKYTWWYHNGRKSVEKLKYRCRVSCLKVPNGIFMIRSMKHKKPVWTGNSLQAMGESRTKLLLMTMDYQGFQPFLKHMMRLNTWHLPDDFEVRINTQQGDMFTPLFPGDLHPDYDFTVRYTSMEPALGKHFRAQQLIQYAQMWAQSPYLQQHQFMKAILEMLDFSDTDKYLKSPEQVAQEQQMMMQTQIQMHLGNMELQDAMAARDDERTLQREIVKGLLK